MYDGHRSITSITVITRRVVSIDFYRLIDTIDNVYVIDIDFYRLPTSGVSVFTFLRESFSPDLCLEEDLNHAMANCFEALLGKLLLSRLLLLWSIRNLSQAMTRLFWYYYTV